MTKTIVLYMLGGFPISGDANRINRSRQPINWWDGDSITYKLCDGDKSKRTEYSTVLKDVMKRLL